MTIEASLGDQRALLDLTIGQLLRMGFVGAPLCTVWFGPVGPAFDLADGQTIAYWRYPGFVNRRHLRYRNAGLVEDMAAFMDLALDCDLDEDRFYETLARVRPAEFELACERIVAFSKPVR